MAIKKVRVEALVSMWAEIEQEADEYLEEAVYRWGKYYDENIRLEDIKYIEVLEEIE